jgi:hypothetical protein
MVEVSNKVNAIANDTTADIESIIEIVETLNNKIISAQGTDDKAFKSYEAKCATSYAVVAFSLEKYFYGIKIELKTQKILGGELKVAHSEVKTCAKKVESLNNTLSSIGSQIFGFQKQITEKNEADAKREATQKARLLAVDMISQRLLAAFNPTKKPEQYTSASSLTSFVEVASTELMGALSGMQSTSRVERALSEIRALSKLPSLPQGGHDRFPQHLCFMRDVNKLSHVATQFYFRDILS